MINEWGFGFKYFLNAFVVQEILIIHTCWLQVTLGFEVNMNRMFECQILIRKFCYFKQKSFFHLVTKQTSTAINFLKTNFSVSFTLFFSPYYFIKQLRNVQLAMEERCSKNKYHETFKINKGHDLNKHTKYLFQLSKWNK